MIKFYSAENDPVDEAPMPLGGSSRFRFVTNWAPGY